MRPALVTTRSVDVIPAPASTVTAARVPEPAKTRTAAAKTPRGLTAVAARASLTECPRQAGRWCSDRRLGTNTSRFDELKTEVDVSMVSNTRCTNPKCSCDPCTCGDCKCGAGLGELERRVMEILWQDPGHSRTGREVANLLPAYAYTTVATVLDRLVRKGFVRRSTDRRAIEFAAIRSRAAHTAVVMHDALETDRESEEALVRFAETVGLRSGGPPTDS